MNAETYKPIRLDFATGIKTLLGVDDPVDSFALHAVGGWSLIEFMLELLLIAFSH